VIAGTLAVAFVMAAAAEAGAECRVEVRPFEGPNRRELRADVTEAIATRCTVVEPGARAGADLIVEGQSRRDGDQLRVKLWVKDAETGDAVRTVQAMLDGPELSQRARLDLHDRLDVFLEPHLARAAKEVDSPNEPAARASTVAVGPSLVARSLSFVPRPDLAAKPATLDVLTRNVYAAGEVYPLSGSLAGLGIGFVVEKELGLTHEEPAVDAVSGASASASQLRWGVGLRYLQPLARAGTAITLGLGYNELVFEMDRNVTLPAAMSGTPDTHYRYLDPSLSVYQPVASNTAVIGTARAWLVLDAGSIVQPEAYGHARLTGFDAELALQYTFAARYPFRLGARYGVVGYAFDGVGERAVADDGDRSTVDVGGARDRYLACALTAGYRW
jgi:hypothetical protein